MDIRITPSWPHLPTACCGTTGSQMFVGLFLVFANILNLLWQNVYVFGVHFLCCKWLNIEKLSSHLVTLILISISLIGSTFERRSEKRKASIQTTLNIFFVRSVFLYSTHLIKVYRNKRCYNSSSSSSAAVAASKSLLPNRLLTYVAFQRKNCWRLDSNPGSLV